MKPTPRTALILLGILIAIAVFLWAPWRSTEGAGAARVAAHEASEVLPSGAALEALDPSSEREARSSQAAPAVPAPAHEPVAPPPESAAAETLPEIPAGLSRLSIRVRSQNDGSPLAGLVLSVLPAGRRGGTVKVHGGPYGGPGEASTTDSEGLATLDFVPDTEIALQIRRSPTGFSETRDLDPLVPGQIAEVLIELPTKADIHFHGRLVDAESGAALRGVVRFARGQDAGRASETDFDGAFELTARSWELPSAWANAEGYARRLFPLSPGHEQATDALLVRLHRSAAVEAWVFDPSGKPIADAHLQLATDCFSLMQRDNFLGPIAGLPDETWEAATDAEGRVWIGELPAVVPLQVSIRAEGWPPREGGEPMVLEAGEQREHEFTLGAGTTLSGLLVDAGGTPIPRRTIWRDPAKTHQSGLFRKYHSPLEATETDEQGRFVFEQVPAGKWWIGPAPGRGRSADDVPPQAQLVEVRGESAALEIVVRVHRDLYIRGRVLDPHGRPAENVGVNARQEGGGYAKAVMSRGGAFSIGPLPAGLWVVSARNDGGKYVPPDPMEVAAGSEPFEIVLLAAGSVRGTIVDGETRRGQPCSLKLLREGVPFLKSEKCADGEFHVQGLRPGSYILMATTVDGRVGLRLGVLVTADQVTEDVQVELHPGSELDLRYDGDQEDLFCRVFSEGTAVQWASLQPGGSTRIVVPPGDLELRWRSSKDHGAESVRKVELAPDERLELTLSDP